MESCEKQGVADATHCHCLATALLLHIQDAWLLVTSA